MAEKQTKTITINDVEYNVDDFTDQQKVMLNHIQDLDRKLSNAQFNLDQLSVGRQAFVDMLVNTFDFSQRNLGPPPSESHLGAHRGSALP